jgi:acetate kinase
LRVLVLNAGSSSLKLSLVDEDDRVLLDREFEVAEGRLDESRLAGAVRSVEGIEAIGHRVVHGGPRYPASVRIDGEVIRYLVTITDLAPLHLPAALAGIAAAREVLPRLPAVACFDTAFHARIPSAASTYALPSEWRTRWALRRYGFHGLSHSYAAGRAAELTGQPLEELRIVTCHLGAGASLAAVEHGVSVDTTMGFTPLEGLVMATRSGSVDPGLVLWLEEHVGMPPSELATTLERRSGLLGLTGSADMRAVLESEAAGDADAALAVDVYLHRLRAGVAAMAAAMDGLDVLVFTGGIGERSAPIRERAAAGLGFLGIALDPAANDAVEPDADIGAPGARVRSLVVEAREDLEIARDVRRVLTANVTGRDSGGVA